jgi:hypothetical protein
MDSATAKNIFLQADCYSANARYRISLTDQTMIPCTVTSIQSTHSRDDARAIDPVIRNWRHWQGFLLQDHPSMRLLPFRGILLCFIVAAWVRRSSGMARRGRVGCVVPRPHGVAIGIWSLASHDGHLSRAGCLVCTQPHCRKAESLH